MFLGIQGHRYPSFLDMILQLNQYICREKGFYYDRNNIIMYLRPNQYLHVPI